MNPALWSCSRARTSCAAYILITSSYKPYLFYINVSKSPFEQ